MEEWVFGDCLWSANVWRGHDGWYGGRHGRSWKNGYWVRGAAVAGNDSAVVIIVIIPGNDVKSVVVMSLMLMHAWWLMDDVW
jgi:hypothetical protein